MINKSSNIGLNCAVLYITNLINELYLLLSKNLLVYYYHRF